MHIEIPASVLDVEIDDRYELRTNDTDLVSETKSMKDSKPPLPKVHTTPKKPTTPKATDVRKPTEKLVRNAKASPRITPKATPLQSPGAEHPPLIRECTVEIIKGEAKEDAKSDDKHEEKKDQGTEKTQVINILPLDGQNARDPRKA